MPDINVASTSEDQERHLSSGLRLLRLVSPLTLMAFLPPLLTHLISLLSLPSQQREAFNTLIDVLHSVYLDATGSALSLAMTYAEFVAAPSAQAYEDIVRLWSDAIRSLEANSVRRTVVPSRLSLLFSQAGDKFVVFSGFWLRLIVKSMAAAPKVCLNRLFVTLT